MNDAVKGLRWATLLASSLTACWLGGWLTPSSGGDLTNNEVRQVPPTTSDGLHLLGCFTLVSAGPVRSGKMVRDTLAIGEMANFTVRAGGVHLGIPCPSFQGGYLATRARMCTCICICPSKCIYAYRSRNGVCLSLFSPRLSPCLSLSLFAIEWRHLWYREHARKGTILSYSDTLQWWCNIVRVCLQVNCLDPDICVNSHKCAMNNSDSGYQFTQ